MILGVTGHRPSKLGFKQYKAYSKEVEGALYAFASEQIQTYEPELILTGMAIGWDTAIADAARGWGTPFHAYIPFHGQEKIWPKHAQERYNYLLTEAAEVIYVSEGEYTNKKLWLRNEAIIDCSTKILALWNGSRGGTGGAIQYANQHHVPIINCWDDWITFTEGIH